jgi:hypothetical protein
MVVNLPFILQHNEIHKFTTQKVQQVLRYNFYSKTNKMHNISNLFYFGTTVGSQQVRLAER